MEDYQFAELMKVLKEINQNVISVKDNLPVDGAYDLGDVCSKLDEVKKAINEIDVN